MCNQELEEGICSLAVPLFDQRNQIVAAMNVTANLSRTTSVRNGLAISTLPATVCGKNHESSPPPDLMPFRQPVSRHL